MNAHVLVNALVVSILNLASVVFGYIVWILVGGDQIPVQLTVTMLFGIGAVVWWLTRFGRKPRLEFDREYMAVFLLSFPAAIALFTGVHYLVTSYLTAFGNIGVLLIVQFMENVIAIPLAAGLGPKTQERRRLDESAHG